MFMLMWGPTVAAVSVVLDHADSTAIVTTALAGLGHAARIAAYHHVDEVLHCDYSTDPCLLYCHLGACVECAEKVL